MNIYTFSSSVLAGAHRRGPELHQGNPAKLSLAFIKTSDVRGPLFALESAAAPEGLSRVTSADCVSPPFSKLQPAKLKSMQ